MPPATILSLAGLRRIGAGTSAEVFALPGGHALKLLLPGIGEGIARRELTASEAAWRAGLPVPAPAGMMSLGERHGLALARLDEARWLRRFRRWPGMVMLTLAAMARRQAAAHRVRIEPGTLPCAREVLTSRIAESGAPAHAIAAATAALAALPVDDRLGHGDLHLGNVMNPREGMMLIDWAQAMAGDPAADVARSELVMRFGRYGSALRRWPALRIARHAAAAWYLFCYRRATGMSDAAIDTWRLPVAVAWWREGSAAHLPALAEYVEARLRR